MSDPTIEFDAIWKKFARGEQYDSLRDLIPSMAKWLFSARHRGELRKKEFWALRDVSFRVGRGEALGIIGPNGSGKSTILKLLSRILRPNRGSLRVRGRFGALIELGAGFHPDLTGRENIYLNGTILGMKRAEIDAKFDAIVAFSELEDFLDTPVKRYSSGMHARLGFSVAAHVDPDILLVDEVLSVGDFHFQQKCFEKMRQFIRNGTSVVFVSHNMTAVSTLCTSALLLRKGESVYQGDVPTALQRYHSFYQAETSSDHVEVIDLRLRSGDGEEREVFQPGEAITVEITVRALADIRDAHPGLTIHTVDGQCIFETATSRLANRSLSLKKGESTTVVFGLDLNLQRNVFLLGFVLTPAVRVSAECLYYNPRLKNVVMSDEQRSIGLAYLNPRVELASLGNGRHHAGA